MRVSLLIVVEARRARPETVNADVEAFPSVVCPVTFNVPFETRDDVAVIVPLVTDPEVSEEIKDVAAERSVAKKLELVAFVVTSLVTVRFVIEPLVVVRLVAVSPVVDAFPRVVWPETVRAVAEAVAKVV